MDQLTKFLKSIKPRFDDDPVDRLNYYYTVFMLLAFAITLSAKQYVGEPLQCWVPAQFTDDWEKYTEDYCYIENTYWRDMYDKIPEDPKVRVGLEISYYQWVPFVLAIQALMFHLPHILWKLLNWQSGLNVRAIVNMSVDATQIGAGGRDDAVKTIAGHIEDACSLQKNIGREVNPFMWFFGFGKGKGIYVTLLYLAIKLLFVANLVVQFFILNSFIGTKYPFWGAEILKDLSTGKSWNVTGHFPRVTLCDLQVRELGNLHRWTVQCVLMINMFNEKIYIFIWWWLLIVAIITIVNLVWWTIQSLSRRRRIQFVKKYYQVSKTLDLAIDAPTKPHRLNEADAVRTFVSSTLRPDGVFVLRLVAANAGDVIATEIVKKLFDLNKIKKANNEKRVGNEPEKADKNITKMA